MHLLVYLLCLQRKSILVTCMHFYNVYKGKATIVTACSGLPWSGKNIWKTNFFSGQGKVREFVSGRGNLERTKVNEFENKRLWQADFRKFIYSVQEGKSCTFSRDCLSPSPLHWRATLKRRVTPKTDPQI